MMGYGSFGGMDAGFRFMSVAFPLVFLLILGVFVVMIIRGVAQWSRNNQSPVLTVSARITNFRESVSRSHHAAHGNAGVSMHSAHTRYYATFEVESGDRIELEVSGEEYGQLAQGDLGHLTFQGTRFKSFERVRA